ANWRVKTTRSFSGTGLPIANAERPWPCFLTFWTAICSARSRATAISSVAASTVPRRMSPPRVRPSYAKVGMGLAPSLVWLSRLGPGEGRSGRPPRERGSPLLRVHGAARAAAGLRGGDHRLQLVDVRAPAQTVLERDDALQVQVAQRLVQRLHAELRLADLHLRVDLVDLVLADEVPDRGVRHHDRACDDALRARRSGHERLRD